MATPAEHVQLARDLWGLDASQVPDAFLLAWEPQVRAFAHESFFCEEWPTAIAHLLAHYAYRLDPTGAFGGGAGGKAGAGAPGTITSIRTGALSVSYGANAGGVHGSAGDFASTRAGLAFLALRDSRPCMNAPMAVC